LDSLRSLDWSSRRLRSRERAIGQVIQKLAGQFQRPPEEQEVAEELNIGLASYLQLLGSLKGLEIGTLCAERRQDSSEEELVYVRDPSEHDPLFRCPAAETRELVEHAVGDLPERERKIVSLRYYEEATTKEIAFVLGVTENRVSQMHASAILYLRARLEDAYNSRQSGVGPWMPHQALSKDPGKQRQSK
jgi:RNA polymerase sigma factor for flagellar operon FliA